MTVLGCNFDASSSARSWSSFNSGRPGAPAFALLGALQALRRRLQGLELILLGGPRGQSYHSSISPRSIFAAGGCPTFWFARVGGFWDAKRTGAPLREGRTPLHHLQLLSAAAATRFCPCSQ
jgi:hypothetical protein